MTDGRVVRERVVPIVVGIALAAAAMVGLITGGVWLLVHAMFGSKPEAHSNPSFKYGEKFMDRDVYGGLRGGSVDAACRAAIEAALDRPEHLNVREAVAGCKYQEWTIDN